MIATARQRRPAVSPRPVVEWAFKSLRGDVRFARDFPGSEEWRRLIEVAASKEPAVRRAFLSAANRLKGVTNLAEFEAALQSRNIERVMQAMDTSAFKEELTALSRDLDDLVVEGGEAAKVQLRDDLRLPVAELSLNMTNVRAIEAARANAARFVTGVDNNTRQAIRNLVTRSFTEGIPPDRLQRMVRAHIGLTPGQSAQVSRFESALRRAARGDVTSASVSRRFSLAPRLPRNVSEGQIERLRDRYAASVLKRRGDTIGAHEPLMASRSGQHALWEEAVSEGIMSPEEFEREWIAVVPSDGKTCPLCLTRNGSRAPLPSGTYPTGESQSMAHILCRCTERISKREDVSEGETPSTQGGYNKARHTNDDPETLLRESGIAGDLPSKEEMQRQWRADGGSEDILLKRINEEQGFNSRPELVSGKDLDARIKGGESELWRGVTNPDHAKAFREGENFIGLGVDGNGTYVTGTQSIAQAYAGESGSVVRMSMRSDARVISIDDINDVITKKGAELARRQSQIAARLGQAGVSSEDVVRELQEIEALKTVFSDQGRVASLMGYDAISARGTMDQMIVLNRSAVRVQR